MTRSPRRRLAAIAAVGVIAVGSLTACRTDAGTAAYVSDTRITDEQVNKIVSSIPAGLAETSNARLAVVNDLVFNTATAKYAASQGIAKPPITDAARGQVAQNFQIDNNAANRPLIDLEAETNEWMALLLAKAPTSAPSDADLMELFNELKADFPAGTTFAQAKPTLLQVPNLPQGLAVRNQLQPAFKTYNISINPRYANNCTKAPCAGPFIPLVQVQGADGNSIDVVTLPLTGANASPPAVDLPSAVSTASATQ